MKIKIFLVLISIFSFSKAASLEEEPSRKRKFKELSRLVQSYSYDDYVQLKKDLSEEKEIVTRKQTLLHKALTKKHVLSLIEAKANIEARNSYGETPLHIAASRNALDIAELLLLAKADINAQDNEGRTPIHHANSSIMFLKLKTANPKLEVDSHGKTPLMSAIEKNNICLIDTIFNSTVYIASHDKKGLATCDYVINSGDPKIFFRFIKPEHYFKRFSYGIVFAKVAGLGHTAILKAIIKDATIEQINTTDYKGQTALHYSAINDQPESIELLIKAGADLKIKDENGNTAFILAVSNSSHKAIDVFLKNGADLKDQDEDGNTTLDLAYQTNNMELINICFDHSIKTNNISYDFILKKFKK